MAEVPPITLADLPVGEAPRALAFPHFPSRFHAYVWRNWELVPAARLARVAGVYEDEVRRVAEALGAGPQPSWAGHRLGQLGTTIVRRNWHLLPYEQLLALLDWTPGEMLFHLYEDDFLYVKLGRLKPRCEPLGPPPPAEETAAAEAWFRSTVADAFPTGVLPANTSPPYGFVEAFSGPAPESVPVSVSPENTFRLRYCFSYFGSTGDPFAGDTRQSYPDAYLARLSELGVNGVWLQAVLYELTPFPWDPARSDGWQERLARLAELVTRARRFGVGVYLYLNEPRAMPPSFFEVHPELEGVSEGTYSALCTSCEPVKAYLREAVATVCRRVPGLAGFFSISASENLTTCHSHYMGAACPRCRDRSPAEVVAEVNCLYREGIAAAGSDARLIVWDWGWQDSWVTDIIARLPDDVLLMSVSEWDLPIRRGGVDGVVTEYSMSAIGPGPRALRHWAAARQRGLGTMAKVQVGTTWELSAVPYMPAVANVVEHIRRLRDRGVQGLMLSWTLGGYPCPAIEAAVRLGEPGSDPEQVLLETARHWFGDEAADAVVEAWRVCSRTFQEFPYSQTTVYAAPLQMGPANLLWPEPSGYGATMVGIPYDDLAAWCHGYPPRVFEAQMRKVAAGFAEAADMIAAAAGTEPTGALADEMRLARVCAVHLESVANQVAFVLARDGDGDSAAEAALLQREEMLARELHVLQCRDSRVGFEASNQYYYRPMDLVEKVANARWIRRMVQP